MQLIAVDKTGSSLCIIDAETLEVLKRLPMPLASHDFTLDPHGKSIFVSIYGSGVYGDNPKPGREIVVVDAEHLEKVGTLDTFPYSSPHGLTFDRRGILWVACDAYSCVIGIDTSDGSIRHVVDTGSCGSHWVLASAWTGYLYTSNKEDRFVSVIDPERAQLRNLIGIPNGGEGMCFSPDGRLLYLADHKRPSVLVIDVAGLAVERTIELPELAKIMEQEDVRANHHMRVCLSADGRKLAVTAYHYDRLILVDLPDARRQITLTTGKGPVAMAFHPERTDALYFSNHDESTLGIVDLGQERVLGTANCGGGIEVMKFF